MQPNKMKIKDMCQFSIGLVFMLESVIMGGVDKCYTGSSGQISNQKQGIKNRNKEQKLQNLRSTNKYMGGTNI